MAASASTPADTTPQGTVNFADKVRVAVIGAGGPTSFSEIGHIPGLTSHPGAHVVALCGRRREVAAQQAARWGIPTVYEDYRRLLDDPTIQAVTIVTPNHTHAEIAIAALAAGKHVLCEKPLATDAPQARAMAAAARRANRVAMVAFTFRYLHGLRAARDAIAAGRIGEPLYFRLWSREARYIGPAAQASWRLSAQQAGTGVIGDLGSHMLDVVAFVLAGVAGPIRELCAQLLTVPRQLATPDGPPLCPDVDDIACLMIRTARGLAGDLFASWVTPTHDRRTLEVVGSQATALVNLTRGEDELFRLVEAGKPLREAQSVPLPIPDDQRHQPTAPARMMAAFIEAVGAQRPDPCDATFEDGLAAAEAVDAALASHQSRRWHTLP